MAGKLTPARRDNCENCRFAEDSRRLHADLECRRNPPIMVTHKSSCAQWSAPGWPDVERHDWCGEFAPYQEGRAALPQEEQNG